MADENNQRGAGHAMFGLNDAAQEEGGSGQTPGPGQPVYIQSPPPSPWSFSGGQVLFILVILLVIMTGVNLYLVITGRRQFSDHAAKQADQMDLVTRRLDSGDDRFAQLRGQIEVMSDKQGLNEQELAKARSLAARLQKQQQASVQQLNAAIARKAGAEEVDKLQEEANAKFGTLSGDIAGTQADLDATKQALTGAKGELTSAIARTHDELIALAHRTDRDYFEFNLAKRKARQKIGTLVIELDKTNEKRNLYNINLYFDDKRTPRKDRAINEPLFFYLHGASSALELVVNNIGRNSISGYVSAPKGFFSEVPNVLTARPGA